MNYLDLDKCMREGCFALPYALWVGIDMGLVLIAAVLVVYFEVCLSFCLLKFTILPLECFCHLSFHDIFVHNCNPVPPQQPVTDC